VKVPSTRKHLVQVYDNATDPVRGYLSDLPGLLASFPLDVSLAYLFSRVELAHNMTLYCGVVKLHRAHRELARSAVDSLHITRDGLATMVPKVLGQSVPDSTRDLLQRAEAIRDKVMHGKTTLEREKREAIAAVIDYADALNDFVLSTGGFRPFGSLQGFKGRGAPLGKATTRWMLKGMGFDVA
jgi:hypothetical protein